MPTQETWKSPSSTTSVKSIVKPSDDSWITSGDLGARDTVLVFRTRALNPKSGKALTNTISSSECESAQNQFMNDKDEVQSSFSSQLSSPLEDSINGKLDSEESLNQSRLTKKNTSAFNTISNSNDSKNASERLGRGDFRKSYSTGNSTSDFETFELNKIIKNTNKKCIDGNVINDNENENEKFLFDDCSSEDIHIQPFSDDLPALKLKITYKFIQTETKLLRNIFGRHGLTEVAENQNYNILWTGVHLKPDVLRNLAPYQRVNHFPRSYELTRKDHLYKNIERMQHLRGLRHFDFIPQSFVLPLEFRDLISAHNKQRGPWIVKPAASSRGRGIFIVSSPDQIPQDEQGLVSKYIADPLCIDGHKCDIRIYVLVTSFDPLIVYIYEEGLVRIATVKYDRDAESLWNPCIHLCNYSINKYHSDYIKSNDAHDEDVGHKWTLSALLRHLNLQGCDTSQLMYNIEDLVIKSILACAQSIISACRMFVPSGNNCFELYGFDILIDDTLKPWLLEVNLSPSLGVDTPLDAKVKAYLISDLLTCVGVPAFSPSMRAYYDSKWTRFRSLSQPRRYGSADVNKNPVTFPRRVACNGPTLTVEEQRIIRNARMQNARRGGFVRIFPTEDTMQRYSNFLDQTTGIPLSTSLAQGQTSYSMIVPHNYNQMLFNNLYGKESQNNSSKEENSQKERMAQYFRVLESLPISFNKIKSDKSSEEAKKLRKQIITLIDGGSELTQLQARQTFSLYLEAILRRLTQEPRDYHEKLILKFLSRVGGAVKAPVFFRNPQNLKSINKARSAMVAKLLNDFLDQYNRDTEAYVDLFDHYGMIPSALFHDFLSNAQEADFEAVLSFHTNLSGTMPYLYNRCGLWVPPTPPIPSGLHGFLKALPAMVQTGTAGREFNKHDSYYRTSERDLRVYKNRKFAESVKNNKNNKNSPKNKKTSGIKVSNKVS